LTTNKKWSKNQVRKPVIKAFQNGYTEYRGSFLKQESAKINLIFIVTKRFITKKPVWKATQVILFLLNFFPKTDV